MLLRTKLHGKTYNVGGATPALAGGAREAAWFRHGERQTNRQPNGSVHGSAPCWHNESASADFHELRQGFSPPNPPNASSR